MKGAKDLALFLIVLAVFSVVGCNIVIAQRLLAGFF